jgi:hypothetical protein
MKYQTVSIWLFPEGYTVRGYYRGASHLIAKTDDLQSAVDVAFATDRKRLSVGLIPAEEEFAELADSIANRLGVK